jgi:glucose/arabinose dehydrogenase
MRHRNPQKLLVIHQDLILSSEHGPKEVDEINLIKAKNYSKIQNFGWPISSKGSHYDCVNINPNVKKIAQLRNSHSKHGFVEPKKNLTPRIGISKKSKTENDNLVLVSSFQKYANLIISFRY